jgi:hypothetical protein
MLVAVVIMFAACYFPVHALSIIRYTYNFAQSETVTVLSLLSHWLCYANSAVNPLIYNFMSGKQIEFNVGVRKAEMKIKENFHSKLISTKLFVCVRAFCGI